MRWLLFIFLPLAGCGTGGDRTAGNVAAVSGGGPRSYPARDFTGVSLRGPDDVEVRTGAGFSVQAQGDPAMLDRLEIAVDGDRLRIGRRSGEATLWSDGDRVRILVTMPVIATAELAGTGDLTIDRAGTGFAGAVSGSGDLTVGRIDGGEVRLAVSGSGTIAASGDADRLRAAVTGSGDIVAPDLRVRSAQVSLVGSGDVRAAVSGEAQVTLAGSGDVDLGSLARCTARRTGSGEVRCGG